MKVCGGGEREIEIEFVWIFVWERKRESDRATLDKFRAPTIKLKYVGNGECLDYTLDDGDDLGWKKLNKTGTVHLYSATRQQQQKLFVKKI